jgi:predicted metal-dependent peptidase
MRDTTFDYTVKTLKQAPETSVNLDADVKVSMQNKLSTLLNKQPMNTAQGAINQTPQGFGRTV